MFVCVLKQLDKHKWYYIVYAFFYSLLCFTPGICEWSVFQCIVSVHSFSLLHFSIWLHLSLFICPPSDGHLGGYAEIFYDLIYLFFCLSQFELNCLLL